MTDFFDNKVDDLKEETVTARYLYKEYVVKPEVTSTTEVENVKNICILQFVNLPIPNNRKHIIL